MPGPFRHYLESWKQIQRKDDPKPTDSELILVSQSSWDSRCGLCVEERIGWCCQPVPMALSQGITAGKGPGPAEPGM